VLAVELAEQVTIPVTSPATSCFEYQGTGELHSDHRSVALRTTCLHIKRITDSVNNFNCPGRKMETGYVDSGQALSLNDGAFALV